MSVLIGVTAVIISDLTQLYVPVIVKQMVDGLDAKTVAMPDLTRAALTLVVLALIAFVSKITWRHYLLGASRQAEAEIRQRLLDKAMALSAEMHQKTRIGQFMALATNDVSSVQQALAFGLLAAFDSLFFSLGALGMMLWLDWRLTLMAILPFPVLGLLMAFSLKRIYGCWDKVQQAVEGLTEKVRESISGMRVLRAYAQADGDIADFQEHNQKVYETTLSYVRIDASFRPLILLFAGSSTALLLWFGGNRVLAGETSVGAFAAFTTYLAQLTWPMIAAGWMLVLLQRGSASMRRIEEMLERPVATQPPFLEHQFAPKITVEGLDFGYPEGDFRLILPQLELAPGEALGIVGEVGSGKTTLLNLLNRFHDPPEKTLFLDGVAIETIPLEQLRSYLSYVGQEPFLFSDTIAANLRLANPEAPQEELERVCRAACLHEEILKFAEGYDTMLGERGISLSGGQKQRLCLARALLKPAPILLLDDTLSAVDHDTEHRILEQLPRGQTRLIVSHRLSAVAEADQILVLEAGRVSQRGTHQTLLQQDGLYKELYDLQSLEETD